MKQRYIAAMLLGLTTIGSAYAADAPAGKKVYVTVGAEGYQVFQRFIDSDIKLLDQSTLPTSLQPMAGMKTIPHETVHVIEVDEAKLNKMGGMVHMFMRRCGGFVAHETLEQARASLKVPSMSFAARPSYKIDNQTIVTPLLSQMQEAPIYTTISDLSAFANRFYQTQGGVKGSNYILNKWKQLAGNRSDITVETFSHSWLQKSVIMTIQGSDPTLGKEVVVLGGHQDSIHGRAEDMREDSRAPGADDDASGIASMTEVIRVMMANNYKPKRTIKFMAYAAEEVGLRGSYEIAAKYKADGVNVIGVMQLDMTNFKGSDADIYLYTDYTDQQQNAFVESLIKTYLPTLKIGFDKCGYGCSDHYSWYNQGIPASMPFEAAFNSYNRAIHSERDTLATMGDQVQHALKFAKLGMAYMVELGSDGDTGGGTPGGGARTISDNNVTLKQGGVKSYGPYKVQGGTNFTANISGTGDADLYVRIGGQPSTKQYDCRPYKNGSNEKCVVKVPSSSDVYIMIRGYEESVYSLTGGYTATK
ncbi:leucyl aminopeptidase [Chitinivorax tropicus]|uniref:Leucyl aminopeptidase n=1 Tax=Chitinivorax tropicus TaxID=714531 RepID=A0A840MJE9_9PROT|nr:M20/M25/M40 family metallo-hydrolase [Chitinivorax tropicus]MBB5018540.1 leucyl aminopeptidase [Chitinivorax tropicus]